MEAWQRRGGPARGSVEGRSVRVLVLGEPGCGKSSLVHFLEHREGAGARPLESTVGFRLVVLPVRGDGGGQGYVELLEVGGHDIPHAPRSLLYQNIDGVLLVHDVTVRASLASLKRWASEAAAAGTFTRRGGAPGGGYLWGLPVPTLVVGNKTDLLRGGSAAGAGREGATGALLASLAGLAGRLRGAGGRKRQKAAAGGGLLPQLETGVQGEVKTAARLGQGDLRLFDAFFKGLLLA